MPECDRSFKRDLRNLDRRLGTFFNGEHIVVTFDRGHGQPVNILRVKAEDGTFRQPDQRDMKIIKGGDLAEGPKMELRLKEAAYKAERMREADKRKAHEKFRDMTKDDKTYLSQKIGQLMNISKSNAAFRRIDHKPGKNVVTTV